MKLRVGRRPAAVDTQGANAAALAEPSRRDKIVVSNKLAHIISFGYTDTKGLVHTRRSSSIPWSRPSTNSRPRYCKNGVFLKRKIDSLQQY